MSQTYRAYCPSDGPAKTAAELARWATRELLTVPGAIYANARDLTALSGTLLAARVAGSPQHGVVQPGTVWLTEAVQ